VSFTWVVGACILAVASFVFGLTGFGIGLVAFSLLPFFVPLATVVPLITLYTAVFARVMTIQLRRDVIFPQLVSLDEGHVAGIFSRQSVRHCRESLVSRFVDACSGVACLSLCCPIRHRRHGWYLPVRSYSQARFRRLMFALLLVLGLAMCVRG
jgi:hypothetical protein